MPQWVNVNGYWKTISDIWVNVNGYWKDVIGGWINVNGYWKQFWSGAALTIQSPVTITKSTNTTTFLTTLTGTNYYWSPGPPSLHYYFEWSTDSGVSWTNLSDATAVNPAYGSSTSYTYQIPTSKFSGNVTNIYRFRVYGTYGTLTNTSTATTTIDGPTDVSITLDSVTPSSMSLSWTTSTNANSYEYEYKLSSASWPGTSGFTANQSITISGLSSSTQYDFRVRGRTGNTTNPGYYGNWVEKNNNQTETVYTFAFGNNLYIGTNGYIGLDAGSTSDSILSTGTGRFIGILPGDLYQTDNTSIWYWSDGTDYIVRWEGYHYGQSSNTRIYQARFTSGASYVSIYALTVSTTTEGTQAFVKDNTTKTSYPSALTTGSEYRVYFDGTTSPVVIVSETEKPKSAMLQVAGLTLGNLDQGYTTLTTATNQQNLPGSVSITPQNFGNGYLYIFYTTGANINQLYVQVSRYDYINTLSFQSITPTYYNVSSNSRGYVVVDLSTKSSYNNAVPWSITVTPYNAGNAGTAVNSSITMSGTNYPAATVGTVSAGNGTLSATVSLSGAANYYTLQVTPSGGSTTTYNQQTGNISLSGLINGTSYTLYVIPKYYYYYDSVDSNSYTYSGIGVSRTGTPVAPTYTITYFGNTNTGGSTSPTSGVLPLTVASNGFTKTGYTFSSWNTVSNGTGTTYYPNNIYNTAANLNLYAQWTITPIIPTITMQGNTGVSSTAGTINWSSTNQSSWSSTGTFSGSGTTETSVSKTGLSPNSTYTGTVTVTSSTGNTASANYSLTTPAGVTVPVAPTGLTHNKTYSYLSSSNNLTRVTSSQKRQDWSYTVTVYYNLSWASVSNADTYEVGYATSSTGTPTLLHTGLTSTSDSDYWYQSDRNTVTYYYFVRARNTAGVSGWSTATGGTSTATSVTGLGITLVNASTGATSSASPGNTAITYLWTNVNTAYNHYSYLTANIAGTQITNLRGPSSGSV